MPYSTYQKTPQSKIWLPKVSDGIGGVHPEPHLMQGSSTTTQILKPLQGLTTIHISCVPLTDAVGLDNKHLGNPTYI